MEEQPETSTATDAKSHMRPMNPSSARFGDDPDRFNGSVVPLPRRGNRSRVPESARRGGGRAAPKRLGIRAMHTCFRRGVHSDIMSFPASVPTRGLGRVRFINGQAIKDHHMLIDWNSSLVLGDARIDQEHQDLVALINQFYEMLHRGAHRDDLCGVAFTLAEQVTQHFNNEADLMVSVHYPGVLAHQREHKMLMGELGAFLHRVEQEDDCELRNVITFIKDWFTTHVTTADAQFVKFLQDNTLCSEPSDEPPLAEML